MADHSEQLVDTLTDDDMVAFLLREADREEKLAHDCVIDHGSGHRRRAMIFRGVADYIRAGQGPNRD